MLSRLRKGLLYPVSQDITEHDLNTDVETWTYDDREVFRGNIDPEYLSQGLNVYWLYDDFNIRVGLAEHEQKDENQFAALWFKENPFATLFQQDGWTSTGETLWSKMTPQAYEDCLSKNIETPADLIQHFPAMKASIITPSLLDMKRSYCRSCFRSECKNNSIVHDGSSSLFFIDDDFVIYELLKPSRDDDQSLVPHLEVAQELKQELTPHVSPLAALPQSSS